VKTTIHSIKNLSVTVFGPEHPKSAVILCHGFGAPGEDLVGLGPALVQANAALNDCRFYFPHGLVSLSGEYDSRAWWPISASDFAAFQSHKSNPEAYAALRHKAPEGLSAARAAVSAVIDSVMADTGLPLNKIALGGFSQGAMLATDVALRLEERSAALVALSGTLLLETQWKTLAQNRQALPVFQSHGTVDPVLPYFAAQSLNTLLQAAGLTVQFETFEGGHTIPDSVMASLARFLSTRLS
jgi:phospholipase/carboxylesterase